MRTAARRLQIALVVLLLALPSSGCAGRLARYDGDLDPAIPPPGAGPRGAPVPGAGPQPGPQVATVPGAGLRTPPADMEDRLVEFIRWRNRRLDRESARLIAVSLLTSCAIYQVDLRLLACLVAVESSFDPRARSRTGAAGLGQLLPSTARELGVSDPHDVDQNLRATASYLGRMLGAWDGRTDLALVSYLEGLGTVKRQVAAGKPLSPQQVLFVQRVMGLYERI